MQHSYLAIRFLAVHDWIWLGTALRETRTHKHTCKRLTHLFLVVQLVQLRNTHTHTLTCSSMAAYSGACVTIISRAKRASALDMPLFTLLF